MKETLLLILFLSSIYINGQSLLINEFMANNSTTIKDEDGDFSDWIELYNATNVAINLLNYSLSDDKDDLNKWVFPAITISPSSYLLIFASGKNRVDTTELHTNFKISSSGEVLYLSNNLGVIIDQSISVALSADESYGSVPDGDINRLLINVPSPNATNNYSNQLTFSNQEGFYTTSFSLKINTSLADTIFYTLNGDVPTQRSTIFKDSLLIRNINSRPNTISEIPTTPKQNLISYKAWQTPQETIDKATIFKCASYRNGVRTSKIYSKTFFVDDEIFDKYTMPVISIITPKENLFNVDTGLFVPGVNFDINDPEWTGNYCEQGDDWERDIHIEYFDQNGKLGFSQDAGLRIHGGKTRQASQKSLRLYARDEYGEKYFNYKLLPKRNVNKYKRFLLRTTMGAWHGQTIIKDVFAQNISASLNVDYQEFQPAIVYINGEYWGIHTIRDRIDERYIEYTHNIDKDSVEFKEWWEITNGNLGTFIKNNSLEQHSNYEYVKTKIDIDNYIDYTIAELFFANYDWPSNNIKLWRKIPGGKLRWVLYDLDAGFLKVDNKMLVHATKNDSSVFWPNSPGSTFLFRNLLKNEIFKSQFINKYAEALNSIFDVEIMKNKLDSIKNIYSPEIKSHIGRWNYPDSFNDWEKDIENELLFFIENRSCAVRSNILAFFNLSNFDFSCDFIIAEADDMIIAPNPTTGSFFLFNNYLDVTNATVTITNINGQIIYEEDNVDIMKNEAKHFNLAKLINNMCVLQIKAGNYIAQKKIITVN